MKLAPLVLASGSPRRRALLSALDLRFEVIVPDVDETAFPGESAASHVSRLALAKSAAASALLAGRGPRLVLTADTTVAVEGEILGKPRDEGDALRMLERLAGRSHEVFTACRLRRTDRDLGTERVVRSVVRFGPWDAELARWYVATGEPMDKAGAYALQGRGVLLTSGIEGSWSNIVGLPLEALPDLFREVADDFARRLMEGRADGC